MELHQMLGVKVPKEDITVNNKEKSVILNGKEYCFGDSITHTINNDWGDYSLTFIINFIKYSGDNVLLLQNKTNKLTDILLPLIKSPYLINMYLDGEIEDGKIIDGHPKKLYVLLKYHPTEDYQLLLKRLEETYKAKRIETVSKSEEAYEIHAEGGLYGCLEALRSGLYHTMSNTYKDIILHPYKQALALAKDKEQAKRTYNTMYGILHNDQGYREFLEAKLNVKLPVKGGLMSKLNGLNYVTKAKISSGELV